MKEVILLFLTVGLWSCTPQNQETAPLPAPLTNNPVVSTVVDGKEYIYTFGGMGPAKTPDAITLRSFRYEVGANLWEEIAPLPDTMPKIAAAASVVKDKIYIIGGYHVFPDGHEKSSPKVHIFDPLLNDYLEDGADILTPIDDQVQAVWNDSLIYVATGWSDSLNVNLVQVYMPGHHWHYATPLPGTPGYQVFGSSGVIVDNSIYYAGGAGNRQDGNFPLQPSIKIGQINPDNPLEISWEEVKSPLARIYRPAAVVINNRPHWIGGSAQSYNYNGIAYTGPAVDPNGKAIYFDPTTGQVESSSLVIPRVMDLRGLAELKGGRLALVGGMSPDQVVSDRINFISLDEGH